MLVRLTAKQELFCQEYLKDLNGAAAVQRAGYKCSTPKVASIMACHLGANSQIQARITQLLERRQKRTLVQQDRVLEEIARLAFADPRQLYDTDGRLLPIDKLPDEIAASIAQVESYEESGSGGNGKSKVPAGVVRKVKLWDKRASLEMLARHLSLFPAVTSVTLNVTLRDLLTKSPDELRQLLRQLPA